MFPKTEEDLQKPRSPTGERATLEGWGAVENEMLKHDEGTMKGHLSDIDTLLVFAGLFSAVLTAFVVESYQQLLPDTGTGSMLVLRRISVQLESFTLSPGFANSSSSAPPLPSLDFVADTTTRWINALWFLSLIFSLAAGLFGILVKQWIREYMQWNSALAPPRDNVLVRQIRFEAWNRWNVPATIAAIPALLELALVFFICGLVILLWTLDPVVSIVITTAASVFLAIASTFTILPAFFRRCPYKSPTAWGCAILWDFITLWIPHTLSRAQFWLGGKLYWAFSANVTFTFTLGKWLMNMSGQDNWRLGHWTAIARDWRARDLADVWASFVPGSNLKRGDATALLDALLAEQSCADGCHECSEEHGAVSSPTHSSTSPYFAQPLLHAALRTITELPPLVRALAWVSQASHDAHTLRSVTHCVNSLDSRFVLPRPAIETRLSEPVLTQEGVRAISLWHLLVSFGRSNDLATDRDQAALKDIATFRESNVQVSKYHRACMIHGQDDGTRAPYDVHRYQVLSFTEGAQGAISILVSLSALSLKGIVEGLPALLSDEETHGPLRSARRAVELLTMLRSFHDINLRNPSTIEATECLTDVLRATYGTQRQVFEDRFPGLQGSVRKVADWLGVRYPRDLETQLFDPTPVALAAPDDGMSPGSKRRSRVKLPQLVVSNESSVEIKVTSPNDDAQMLSPI